jgi:nitroreductase
MSDADRLMTLFEAIAKRHAVRASRPDRIDESTVRELLKEAPQTPREAPDVLCWRNETAR